MMVKMAAADATLSAKLVAKDMKPPRMLLLSAPPARVAPPPARVVHAAAATATPKPSLSVTFDPASDQAPTLSLMRAARGASPAFVRAAKAASPAFMRAASALSPAVAKAAGVSELYQQVLYQQVITPNTRNKQRLDTWATFASMEKQAQLDKWAQLEPSAPTSRRPAGRLPVLTCA